MNIIQQFIAKARGVQEIGRCYSCDEAIEYEDCTCSEVGELALKRDQFSRINFCRMLDVLEKQAAALEFYAKGNHFEFDDCIPPECEKQSEPDTVSGEPENFLCGHGEFTFECGAGARECLRECEKLLGGGE